MSITTNRKEILSRLWKLPKTIGDYIFDTATRIFSPNKDDYPKTGTQPYKGDPNEEK